MLFHLLYTIQVSQRSLQKDLPPFAYHSPVPWKQRMDAVHLLEKALDKTATKSNGFHPAAQYLRAEAAICEPLGVDAKGSSAYTIIEPPPDGHKIRFGIVPIYASDASASPMLREFIKKYPKERVGLDPDGPFLYFKAVPPLSREKLLLIVKGVSKLRQRSANN